jgi:hypothetical protein
MSVEGSLAKDMDKARRYLPQYMRYLVDRTSEQMKDAVQRHTPVRTGELKESIVTIDTNRRFTGTGVQVWTGGTQSELKRASYTEYDTAPHIIRARSHLGLKFFDRRYGVVVVRDEVFHPGTTGVHMFAKGSDEVEAALPAEMEAMLNRWKRRYGFL